MRGTYRLTGYYSGRLINTYQLMIAVLANVALVIAILGYFGVETWSAA